MPKRSTLDIGELILTGIAGHSLSSDSRQFLSDAKIGGVIYFAHNYQNPSQIQEFSRQIQETRSDLPLWIATDHEGGRVQRFRQGFSLIPKAADIAKTGSAALAFEIAELMARELKTVGVNLNYSPVADITTNLSNPVIGDRAFGFTAEEVSKFVSAVVRGHLTQGIVPCLKHFPGHGDTSVDSHFDLPRVDTPLETLEAREFKPFLRGMKSKCPMVMSAHVLNPTIDPDRPATFSRKTMTGILRDRLGFKGIISTDDMEMHAVSKTFGAEEAPVLAIEAGCDVVIYRSEPASRIAYESLVKAFESGRLSKERIQESLKRIRGVKKKLLESYAVPGKAELSIIANSDAQTLLAQVKA